MVEQFKTIFLENNAKNFVRITGIKNVNVIKWRPSWGGKYTTVNTLENALVRFEYVHNFAI